MADLYSKNRELFIKKYERDKLVALTNIQSREIRIMELEEEIERNRADIEAHNKLLASLDMNIKQQLEEIGKAKSEAK
jgi:hypothetical protein